LRAKDIMTTEVVSVKSEASILEAVRLMLQNRISGLPVVDRQGVLVGVLTEGDFLRRTETGTERRRSRWLELFIGQGQRAEEYVRTHGRKVMEVMNPDPLTITEDTTLEEIVSIMEQRRVKRLPVTRGTRVVGIVSRANLLQALASVVRELPQEARTDTAIREQVLCELQRQNWEPTGFVNVLVRNGVVELWGTILDERERDAAKVAAENVVGVKAVKDHLVWVEPISGMVLEPPADDVTPKVRMG
jgi:CBS domain-containing protein